MPTATLTKEQIQARDTRDVSVALSAGAGCGKTHVLTARFLSHLDPATNGDDPARLHQLIAITFTDAAAREMRTRIRNACYEKLESPEVSQQDQAQWLRLLREIDTARVSTIHAFCTALLRAHAPEAGLDPTFGVLEQSEADVLLYQVIDDVLRGRLAAQDDDTLDLAAVFGRLSQLKQRLVLLVNQRHRREFNQWLVPPQDQAAKAEELLARWKECYARDSVRLSVEKVSEKAPIRDMLKLLASATPTAGNKNFVAARSTLTGLLPRLQNLDANIKEADLDAIVDAARVQSVCKKNDWPTSDDFETYKGVCNKLREAIKKSKTLWNDATAREAAVVGLKLLRLAGDVAAAYKVRKDAEGKLDFDDQLAFAHRLLSDPKNATLREHLSTDLRLLLVDEFQDTDPLQVELIKMICGEDFDKGRLFFVGDLKQSIYRFRGAVPPEFINLRKQIPESGRLPLTRNFRSQPGILHFVNALFCGSFAEYDALQPDRSSPTNQPAVEFLWTTTPEKYAHGKGNVEAARREEATALARRLRQLFDESCSETPIVEKETGPRRALPGDVAILFRALSDVRLYEEALREQSLDYYLVGGHAFYAQQEIFDVLNLLRAVSSSADEVSLAGVLRSPFFALADESLFWLVDRGGSLNAGLFAEPLPPELSAEERAKVAAAADTIGHLRAIKNVVPIATLLNEALARTGYDAAVLAEFLGERKLANLQKLIEQARAADQAGADLNDFITQLAEFIAQPPKEPLASTSPESANVIRLMTIHRAKGLEFPLVVVPDLDRPPRLDCPDAALDAELGPLVRLPDDEGREESATGMSLFAARQHGEELEERKRLLYVACTRAADYLILSSSVESLEKPKSDWMVLIADRFNLATGECTAELPPDFEPPRVHVAPTPTEAPAPVGKSRGPDLIQLIEDARRLAAEGGGADGRDVAPIPVDHAARRQFSVSRLTGQIVRNDLPWTTPGAAGSASAAALQEARIDPRGLGLLVHDVLAHIELDHTDEIADWCEHLAPLHVVQNADRAAEHARSMIERFVASPRGRQLFAATLLHREIEFLLAWPPGESNGDGRHLHGFIDCLYQDAAGAWRLADYKTNDVAAADAAQAAQQYEMQMYVYAIAAERALGQSPTELVLHFLRPGVEHVFPWNATTRQRAIEMVNEAITAATTASPAPDGLVASATS